MAIQTYRYRWLGPNVAKLNMVALSVPIQSSEGPLPPSFMNFTIDDTGKNILDEILLQQGWGYEGTATAGDLKGLALKQVITKQLTIDDNATNTSFASFLSQVITTDAGFLEIYASLATTALVTAGYLRILVDFAPVADGGAGHQVGLGAQTIVKRVPVTADIHTVELQWRVDAGGTLQCRPASLPGQEHATLLLRETT